MTTEEFSELLDTIHISKSESQTLEVQSAHGGCPARLYDTLSAFSNQDEGGIIIFGIDENKDFTFCGVCNPEDLQQKVTDQSKQMSPLVRPLFTVLERKGKLFVAAEIPGLDMADRPCFYLGKGRVRGSCIRVGDANEKMREYEVYSYEAFRKKYRDDIRTVERADVSALDELELKTYLEILEKNKPKVAKIPQPQRQELLGLVSPQGGPTLASLLLFCPYPQAYFPQLSIMATALPGTEIGELGDEGGNFLDNKRIEGTLKDMLKEAMQFICRNMRVSAQVDGRTGTGREKEAYPLRAVREALLNALVHRDYSCHTESIPIQIRMYQDRMEITNPGGLYGRLRMDQLGKAQPDTRNPVLATALENMGLTKNRHSGIPTIERELANRGLPPAEFSNVHGFFKVIFRKKTYLGASRVSASFRTKLEKTQETMELSLEERLLEFCTVPRSRQEIMVFLGLKSSTYAIQRYVNPLVEVKKIGLSIPEKPSSSNQTYQTLQRV